MAKPASGKAAMRATQKALKETAREMKRAQTAQLKEFRKQISTLKKQHIISKKYDARSVKPTKYLKSVVREFKDVATGAAKTVKLPKNLLDKYKSVEFKSRGNRLVVPVRTQADRVVASKHGVRLITRAVRGTIEELKLPVGFSSARDFLQDVFSSPEKWRDLKRPDERWAFRFYGKNSLATYDSLEQAIEDLDRYDAVMRALRANDAEAMQEVFRHVSLFRIKAGADWPRTPRERQPLSRQTKAYRNWKRRQKPRTAAEKEKHAEYERQRRAVETLEQAQRRKERNREAQRVRRQIAKATKGK